MSAAIGSPQPGFGALALAAVRGREVEARALIDATISHAETYGLGLMLTVAHFHHAVLCNGLGQYEEAVTASQTAAKHQEQFGAPHWALAELVEAGTRSGAYGLASEALEQLSETTQASGTDWALGAEARSRALLSEADAAERPLPGGDRAALPDAGPGASGAGPSRLRRVAAPRGPPRRCPRATQHRTRDAHRVRGRGVRRARAPRAAGGRSDGPQTRPSPRRTALTSQEQQIARFAGDGLTNPEIGARLFLSPHTVEWHLRKVFSNSASGPVANSLRCCPRCDAKARCAIGYGEPAAG